MAPILHSISSRTEQSRRFRIKARYPLETTDAIILKAAPYSETTLLLTLLTREQGMARALAKGARRTRQSAQAAFEPFAWIQCQLRLKSHDALGTLFNPEIQETWDYLRRDVNRLAYAGLGIEVIGALATHSAPEPRLFDEVVNFLRALGETAAPGSLAIALLLRLLHEAGFPPHLAEPWVPDTLPAELTYHFASGRFESPRPGDPAQAMRLPRAALLHLLPFIFRPPPLDASFVVGSQAGAALLRWLIQVWQDHLNETLKSGRFFRENDCPLIVPARSRPGLPNPAFFHGTDSTLGRWRCGTLSYDIGRENGSNPCDSVWHPGSFR